MRLPRDVSGRELVRALAMFGYAVVRQTGSHIRLATRHTGVEHLLTIPDHDPIKLGTLNGILTDVAGYLKLSKQELLQSLFG